MGYHTLFTLLACVISFHDEVSAEVRINPLVVRGYNSYLDVTPVKYDVPPGTSNLTLAIYTERTNPECVQKTFDVLVQQRGLPHVIQTNLTYPSNFLVDWPYFMHQLKSGESIGFEITWPPPGSWFIIAYTEKVDKTIKQKGLTENDDCIYYFMSSMKTNVVENSTVIDYNEQYKATIGYEGRLFRFAVPASTMNFKVQLTNCEQNLCNLNLIYPAYSYTKLCRGTPEDCVFHVASPSLMYPQFLEISLGTENKYQNVTFSILVKECAKKQGGLCVSLPELDRVEFSRPFKTSFKYLNSNSLFVNLVLAPFVAVPFKILDPNDIGGTLRWTVVSINYSSKNKIIAQICGKLYHDHLPDITSEFDLCTNVSHAIIQNFTLESTVEPSLYVPYPKAGIWNILLHAVCFDDNNRSKTPCPSSLFLQMNLNILSCMDDECSNKGSCMLGSFSSDLVFYSACQCDAGYEGYACTDNTNAESVSYQLAGAYLLTMSNLFFAPAIFIAVRRRYFVEAVVYLYNMFFSTFYHACDGTRLERYRLCITKYEVLQSGDFFGSACSLWFTLIAMAHIKYKYVSPVLQIVGPLCLLIGVISDKTSLYVILVPIACGLFIIVASWGQKMYKKRKLYPSWRRYAFFLLPGLILAGTGASAFSFFETEENYQYVHSVWHMCIALSICLFLPPRHRDDYKEMDNSDMSNLSNQLIFHDGIQSTTESGEEINAGYVNETS